MPAHVIIVDEDRDTRCARFRPLYFWLRIAFGIYAYAGSGSRFCALYALEKLRWPVNIS